MESTIKDSIRNIRYFIGIYIIYVVVALGLSVAEILLGWGVLGILVGFFDIVMGLFIVFRIDQGKQNGIIQITQKSAMAVVATQALLVVAMLLAIALLTLLAVSGVSWLAVILMLIASVPLTMFVWGIYLLPVYTLHTGTGYIRGIRECYKYVSGYKGYIFWEATKLGLLWGLVSLSVSLLLLVSGVEWLNFSMASIEGVQSIAMCFITPFLASNTYEIYVRILKDKMPASSDSVLTAVGDGLGGLGMDDGSQTLKTLE